MTNLAARDPDKVCGDIWFNGTEEQRKAFGKGTEGRGRDEHPPKVWWTECIRKISESGSLAGVTEKFDKVRGNYTAVKTENGKWTIKDVPIFAEVKDKDSQIGRKVSVKLLEKLVAKSQARAKEKYFPPLHINHHEDNKDVFQIGFFLPKSIDKITYNGEETAVILADLIDIPEEIYLLIKAAKLPYRSVELFGLDGDEPEITGLALLEHETPFFRLPLLTIQKEISDSEKQIALRNDGPIRAFQNIDSDRCRVLFSLGGIMKEKFEEKPEEERPEEEKPEEDKASQKKFAEMTSDEKITAIYDLLQKILDKIGEEGEKEEPKEPEEQEETGPVEMKAGKANEKSNEKSNEILNLKLQGKVTVLEDRVSKAEDKVSKMESEKSREKLISDAKKELSKFNLSNIDDKLKKVAEKGKDAMTHFIAGVKEAAMLDPEESLDKFDNKSANATDPDLMEFSQQGPDIYARAIEASRQFELVKKNSTVSRKLFIAKYVEGGGNGPYVEEKP